jgi:threonine dehydrogenase-like Zn-dependent dehydrogenase
MRAVTWRGVNEIDAEDVVEPQIINDHDIILEVGLSATCGSDLHLLGGYIPAMRAGDVLGHEFMGTVVETGSAVTKHQIGERVVVVSFTSCGKCWYCQHDLWSLCDNGNPNPGMTEALWGQSVGGCYGYSHALGGWAGRHARYIRVPYADQGAFPIPDDVSDERALFASDAAPTGWTGAHQAGVQAGDVVAVWGGGGVGQMAARAAMLMGAERVVVIDRFDNRLEQVRTQIPADTINCEEVDVPGELREMTGGRTSTTRSSSSCACRPTGPRPCARRSTPAGRAGRCSPSVCSPALWTSSTRRGHEQGADPARRPAARTPLHPRDPRAHEPRRGADGAPGDPRDVDRGRAEGLPDVQGQGGRVRPGRLPPGRVTLLASVVAEAAPDLAWESKG